MADFDLKEAVITTRKVLYLGDPILLVSQGSDGVLCFLGGEETGYPGLDEARVVALETILSLDNSLEEVIKQLGFCELAYREDIHSEWVITEYIEEEEE